jgi:AcrR family transcriptional regulator
VTERTFFRYFPGKEALLVKDIEAWLPILGREIRQRPVAEPALDAVENAFFAVADQTRTARPNLSWLFHDGPPAPRLEKSTPSLLLKFEQEIADALDERARHGRRRGDDTFTNRSLRAARSRHCAAPASDTGNCANTRRQHPRTRQR